MKKKNLKVKYVIGMFIYIYVCNTLVLPPTLSHISKVIFFLRPSCVLGYFLGGVGVGTEKFASAVSIGN